MRPQIRCTDETFCREEQTRQGWVPHPARFLRRVGRDACCSEHPFENHAVREYFSDWAVGDPLLQEAYVEASEWTLKGGSNLFWPRDVNKVRE